MTMAQIRRHIEGFSSRRKNEWEMAEWQAWQIGIYVSYAIGISFSKKVKYPDNPLKQEEPIDITKMTENEIAEKHQTVLENLDLIAKMAFGKKGE